MTTFLPDPLAPPLEDRLLDVDPRTRHTGLAREAYDALDVVLDPELDEPVTDLGFVRSLAVAPGSHGSTDVEVHLRLPTSFCSPSFAYLMAGDAQDVLTALEWTGRVVVELDEHHDSAVINAGLASGSGWAGTYAAEEASSLEELRATFRRKAHTAAMERCLTDLLRADDTLTEEALADVVLGDLAAGEHRDALLRRREALGLRTDDEAPVLVDAAGVPHPREQVPMALRRARSTRVSVDGNAHFCRGLLRTRYPGSDADQTRRADGSEPADTTYHAATPTTAQKETQR
ncbi:iron-sulfur cluster assembly protein [Nocardioides bruguierae]|uniref:Iron-sulfur cluster assembly protein n=1 Tax=Nocardioides bruguierae TaxID=2945102 RepID=A0A9X2D9K5_9ACTN|nr:iron-sulfur cluster assembly protein [Nocardioides bruguierae]MCM0621885.1 iron-sulfur cluster assembly protein [Nocardioides bruguierae]